jgi:hypothetical protein
MKPMTPFTFVKRTGLTLACSLLYSAAISFDSQGYAHESEMSQPAAGITHQHNSGETHAHATMVIPPGQPVPTVAVDAKPNDLLHWQTTLVVKDIAAIAQRLRLNQASFISPNVVAIPGQTLGFKTGILIRDPDGHTLRLVEK